MKIEPHMILSQKVTEKQFSIKIMLYWSHPARFNYVLELTRNFICTNILATEAKSPSKKTNFGWCDYLNRSGVQNINVSVCQRWMTEKTTEFKPTIFSEKNAETCCFLGFCLPSFLHRYLSNLVLNNFLNRILFQVFISTLARLSENAS